jgi:hypothetical protein
MPFDSKNLPIWLRKLHVSAAQMSSTDYPATPEEGIRQCCRLSDAVLAWSQACTEALGLSLSSPPPPLDRPFHSEHQGIRDGAG